MPDMNQHEWDSDEPRAPRPIVPPHPIARMVETLRKAKAATWWRFCLADKRRAQCPICSGHGNIGILHDYRGRAA